MVVLRSIEELSALQRPLVLAIGVFDGVHIGHQAVIDRALDDARKHDAEPVVVTFDPHPAKILRPDLAPRLLTCPRHKQRIIAELGAQTILILSFDQEIANTPPEDFVRQLVSAGRPLKEICVGASWAFGKGRSGNLQLLKALGAELNFEAIGIPDIRLDGHLVSSTVVRTLVESGNLKSVEHMLGRDFSIIGTVVEGKKLGRDLGFPTANLRSENEQLPPNGVYFVEVQISSREGMIFRGVANIGVRPTVDESRERLCEVHLLDFAGELYGQELEVCFKSFLRAEKKFESIEALREQIANDVCAATQMS